MRTPDDVLAFWFAPDTKKRWFNSTPEFDAGISDRFELTAQALAADPFPQANWETDANSALALIILLDQVPRNMYRGSAKAFAWDPLALGVAERAIDLGFDQEVEAARRAFFYMPFMHAEDLAAQDRCVALTGQSNDEGTHRHAIAHRDVIAQFGRFPHRNTVLGRESTAEEREFLATGGYNPS